MPPKKTVDRVRRFNARSRADEVISGVDLHGKTVVITGASSGLGEETAKVLALNGANVVMFNRNVAASEEIIKGIVETKSDAKMSVIQCDLNSLVSVKKAAEEFLVKGWPLDVLILNAGVYSPSTTMTSDGLESCFGVNHVVHQLLLTLLLPILRKKRNGRLVVVSSNSHVSSGISPSLSTNEKVDRLTPKKSEGLAIRLYARSKLCNILMAFKVHREEAMNGVATYVLHPGAMIPSKITRDAMFIDRIVTFLMRPFTKTVSQGAATIAFCATSPDVQGISGKYWDSCWDDENGLERSLACDQDLQDALWDRTNDLIEEILEQSI